MDFIVNGADWFFDGMPIADVEELIEKFLSFVDISVERGETVEIGDNFQTRPMRDAQTLWDLFAENTDQSLSGELRQEMAAWLGSVALYADAADWPDGIENSLISIDGESLVDNLDAAWAHHCVRGGHSVACITLSDTVVYETTTASGRATLFFVGEESGRRAFWRKQIRNDASLARLAPHAYPDIHFVDGVLDHMNRLAGGYLALSAVIGSTFANLDDWGRWIFECPPPAVKPNENVLASAEDRPDNDLIKKRFLGLGMTAAPEKPNVYQNLACRNARVTVLNNRSLYCGWHVKLELHRNRIHIHRPVEESNHKVIVGMIAEHLPLP